MSEHVTLVNPYVICESAESKAEIERLRREREEAGGRD